MPLEERFAKTLIRRDFPAAPHDRPSPTSEPGVSLRRRMIVRHDGAVMPSVNAKVIFLAHFADPWTRMRTPS